jgi:hypothetical protein
MRRWGALVGGVALAAMLMGGELSGVGAQAARPPKPEKDTIETRSATSTDKKGGAEPQNTKDAAVSTRSGPTSCDIKFINTTPYYIHRVYVDGRRVGSLYRGYSEATVYDESTGATQLYAEADFTDGPTHTWGPRTFNCVPNSTYVWRLLN